MAIPRLEVRCHGCDYIGHISWKPLAIEYRLPDGRRVRGRCRKAWCFTCDGITDAEGALGRDEIQANMTAPAPRGVLSRLVRRLSGSGNSTHSPTDLLQQEGLKQLAKDRKSGPKCLHCGGQAIVPLEFGSDGNSDVRHHCSGILYLIPVDPDSGPLPSYRLQTMVLDSEGNKL